MILFGTGHRPNKLGGYGPWRDNPLMRALLDELRTWLTALGPTKVISGMAQGFDWAFAVAAYDVGIPFIAAVPCDGQSSPWPKEARAKYDRLLSLAAEVVVVSPGPYAPWKMQRRNEWMVTRGDRGLACWDGSPGGTANCIAYARSVGKPVEPVIDPRTLRNRLRAVP